MKKYIVVFFLIMYVGCAANDQSPHFKEISRQDMKELEYAAVVEEKLYSQFTVTGDHAEVSRLNNIADKLKGVSQRPYWPTRVYIITDPGYINACTGGRHIYIGQGLLDLVESNDEIAYIIAHERAHIDNSHPMKAFESAQKVGIFRKIGGYATSIFFAFLPAGAVHPGVSFAAQNSIAVFNQVTSDIIYKGYKRSFEVSADEAAVDMMRKTGYDPEAAIIVLSKLERATKQSQGGIFADHPSYEYRIEDIQEILNN